jgi:hypothetical protein
MKTAYRDTPADIRCCAPAAQGDNEKNIML